MDDPHMPLQVSSKAGLEVSTVCRDLILWMNLRMGWEMLGGVGRLFLSA